MYRLLCSALLVGLAATTAAPLAATADDSASTAAPGTVLITGASRGLGLEFARQYAALGWRVLATCRTPPEATELQALARKHPRLSVEALDVTDPAEIAAVAARHQGEAIDVLINNAAYLGDLDAQVFGQLDFAKFQTALNVNLIGPLRVTEALLDNVARSPHGRIVVLGSAAGSVGLYGPGAPLYAYRSSKAALHYATHELAADLAPRGILVGLLNPGIVDTKGVLDRKPGEPVPEVYKPLMAMIERGELQLISPPESVRAMIGLIDGLTPERAGRFYNYDGTELPW